MKDNTLLFVCIIGVAGLCSVGVVQAQIVPCDGVDCTVGSLMQLANNILKFFVEVAIFIAAIVIAWGGFTMVTAGGDTGKVSKGRELMSNAVVGIIIVLAAFLLIDTIMKLVLKDPDSWNNIIDAGQITPTHTAIDNIAPIGTGTELPSVGQMAHTDAMEALRNAGISVVATGNKIQADCSMTSGCTSFQGINAATIQDAIDLKNDCNCSVVITGGTESTGGHKDSTMSHGTGFKYDAGKNVALDAYIRSNYENIGVRSDGAVLYRASDGVTYADEGNHWDVLVPAPPGAFK